MVPVRVAFRVGDFLTQRSGTERSATSYLGATRLRWTPAEYHHGYHSGTLAEDEQQRGFVDQHNSTEEPVVPM